MFYWAGRKKSDKGENDEFKKLKDTTTNWQVEYFVQRSLFRNAGTEISTKRK